MPTIIKGSISILSDAGLGMAMFSLGIVYCQTHLPMAKYIAAHLGQCNNLQHCFACRLQFRALHGSSAQNHSLWQICCGILHGRQVPDWTSGDCSDLHRHRPQRSPLACCYCAGAPKLQEDIYTNCEQNQIIFGSILIERFDHAGCSPTRNSSICVCKGVQLPPRHSQHCVRI